MANKKTSDEVAAGTLDGTELVRITQAGASVRTTAQAIADLGGAAAATTDIAGTTAGHAYIHQVSLGAGKPKKVVAVFVGYENTTGTPQTHDYDAAYDHSPVFVLNTDPACTADATTLTLPASMAGTLDGIATLEGI